MTTLTLALDRLDAALLLADYALKAKATDGADTERRTLEAASVRTITPVLSSMLGAVVRSAPPSVAVGVSRITRFVERLRVTLERLLGRGAALGVETAQASVADLDLAVEWGGVHADALKWAHTYSYELVKGVNATSRDVLRLHIAEWIKSGEPLDALRDRLAPHFGESRAQAIGVTEVTRAFSEGNRIGWKASGVIDEYRFNTANDDLVCVLCSPLNGKVFKLDDDTHRPPIHTLCRCWTSPHVDD